MSQEVKHEILSEVNSHINSLNEAANSLSNVLKQTGSITDFAQQALIDVNSQPLVHNLMDNHPLMSHSALTSAPSNQALLASNSQLLPQALNSNDNTNGNLVSTTTENNSPDNIQLDPSSPIIMEFYERFATGRMFQTLEELRTEAYEYGRKHNVALTTSKSDKTKIYLICKHGGQYRKNTKRSQTNKAVKPRIRRSQKTGCACMIYARCCRGSFWIIRKSVGEHNHPIAEDPRTYAMYRSLSPEHLLVVHRLLREHVGVSFIVKSLKANGVTNILAKDIENIQQDLKRRDVLDLPNNNENNATVEMTTESSVTSSPIVVMTSTPTISTTTATTTTPNIMSLPSSSTTVSNNETTAN